MMKRVLIASAFANVLFAIVLISISREKTVDSGGARATHLAGAALAPRNHRRHGARDPAAPSGSAVPRFPLKEKEPAVEVDLPWKLVSSSGIVWIIPLDENGVLSGRFVRLLDLSPTEVTMIVKGLEGVRDAVKQAERRAASTHVDEEGRMWVELPSNLEDAQKYREQTRAVIEAALDPERAEIAFHYLRHDKFLEPRLDPVRIWLTEANEQYPQGRGLIVTIRDGEIRSTEVYEGPGVPFPFIRYGHLYEGNGR